MPLWRPLTADLSNPVPRVPTRGQADILPTGRNFYSVDPGKIPTPAAWEVGKRLGDALLQRYQNETSAYPRSVGIIVYGGPTMRSGGDDIAEILYLMGVKPVWHPTNGMVKGLEIIPQKDLGRPGSMCCPGFPDSSGIAFPCWCNGSTRPWPWWPPWMSPWTPI